MEAYRFDRRWQLAEARIFDHGVSEWGLRDAYWAAEEGRRMSSSEDFTHVVHNASTPEKRSDYRLVSERIEVLECEIWNGVGSSANGLEVSDHAPVVATVTLE